MKTNVPGRRVQRLAAERELGSAGDDEVHLLVAVRFLRVILDELVTFVRRRVGVDAERAHVEAAPNRPPDERLGHGDRVELVEPRGLPAVCHRRVESRTQVASRAVRRYFGTDGVRGVVGDDLTEELVRRLGAAFARWSGGAEVLVGRDTRASGPALEEALAAGLADGGSRAVLGGVLPTPAVALLAAECGAVVSASHNPAEYNGVKLFAAGGRKLSDDEEERDRGAPRRREARRSGRSRRPRRASPRATSSSSATASARRSTGFGSPSTAPTARSSRLPRLRLGGSAPSSSSSATSRTGRTSTLGAARPTSRSSCAPCARAASTSAWPSTATATGCWQSTRRGASSTATRSSPCSPSTSASTSWRSRA